ncbi:redoxin family protein [Nitrosopumilus sp.]|uniref:redoxin family protein n=1 Tax=Nitrosopumilus sp. TaxID=2024843 RepID=UPI002629ED4A|nr:redoxin family protein [Nitrosopumilus sp.]
MKSEFKTALILGIAITTAVGIMSIVFSTFDEEVQTSTIGETISKIDKSRFKMAPDLVGIAHYLNTTPEQLEKEVEGKVVLYDIWTYSCINCIRTLPYITAWDDKYSDQGLLIVGIHSPEFEFEKNPDNVQMSIDKHGINYPVVMDNDMETWKAFENRYWPRKYIADHEGYIRYDHIGEGAYQETEKIIQQLLKERSEAMGIQFASAASLVDIEEFEHSLFRTPELYFGYKFAQNRNQLGSEEGFQPGQIVTYSEPDKINLHNFYPVGQWKNYDDSMELVSETGSIKLLYNAKEVNIVTEGDAELEILLDGKPIPPKYLGSDLSSSSMLSVSEPNLYNIISSDESSTHELEINVVGKGFQIFTYTFG